MKIRFSKKAGYCLYGILYSIFRLFNTDRHLVYFIMTHDSSDEGNCGTMKQYFEAHPADDQPWKCQCLTRRDTHGFGFIIRSAYTLARSRYVFMDNAFLPLAYLKLRPETMLIQLWHGTGTVKKFGQHVNSGELGALEARCGKNISCVTVSSEATHKLYSECFSVSPDKVKVTGLPRSDFFFNPELVASAKASLTSVFPEIKNRRLILYAPTFRDDSADEQEQLRYILELTGRLSDCLPDNTVLGLRLHPSLCDSLKITMQDGSGTVSPDNVIDLSRYPKLNTLLASTDLLITDYSSIIFEYALLNRPMLFYAYDLTHFENSDRGFYRDYRTFVPGDVFTGQEELIRAIINSLDSNNSCCRHEKFIHDAFAYNDGRSAQRIYEMITEK